MNPRVFALIRQLTEAEGAVSVRRLAEGLGCSEKTVRNDLPAAKAYLEAHTPLRLVTRPGVGVLVEGTQAEKERAARHLREAGKTRPRGQDPEGRRRQLARLLLEADGPVTLARLAGELHLSKASVHADLDRVEPWFAEHGLTILRKPNVGIRVEGEEKDRRLALSRLTGGEGEERSLASARAGEELSLIREEVRRLERTLSLAFTEEGLTNLTVHLAVALSRIRRGQTIRMPAQELARLKERAEFRQAGELARRLEKRFALRLPEAEVGYIAIHLLGAKLRQTGRDGSDVQAALEGIDPGALQLAEGMAKRVGGVLGRPLEKDPALLSGLALHLHSALNRLRHGLRLDNPLLAQIQRDYRFLFETVVSLLPEWEEERGVRFSAAEAGYLTLHFQAALERSSRLETRKRALVVCASGMGTSQLLLAKLDRLFPELEVADTVASYELNRALDLHRPDLVISTVPLERTDVAVVRVTPLLPREEQDRLRERLDRLPDEREGERGARTLRELLQPGLVFPRTDAGSREELLRRLAAELAGVGLVDEGYADSVLERERLASTAIGGGVAIPHGAVRHIRAPGLAAATMKRPLDWDGEPVDIVFLLALPPEERERTQAMFRELVDLAEDPVRLKELKRQTDPQDWIDRL